MLLKSKISDAGVMFFKECFRELFNVFINDFGTKKYVLKTEVGVRANKREAFMQKYLTAG